MRKASWVSAWRRSTRSDPTTSSGEAGRAAVQRHCDVGHSIRTPRRACGLPLMTSHWLVRRECRRSCHLTSPAGMCRWSTAQWQPLRIVVAREFRIMRCRTHPFAVVEQGATLGQPSWWSSGDGDVDVLLVTLGQLPCCLAPNRQYSAPRTDRRQRWTLTRFRGWCRHTAVPRTLSVGPRGRRIMSRMPACPMMGEDDMCRLRVDRLERDVVLQEG